MPFLLGLALVVGLAAMLGGSTPSASQSKPRSRPRDRDDATGASLTEMAARDPVAAPLLYGELAAAAQLKGQGVDLSTFGYGGSEPVCAGDSD